MKKKKKKLKILYDDKDLLIVDKPAGLLTISTNNEKEKTLFHQVLTFMKQKNKNNKVFIVHRLDRDTSGIIIFAKNERVKFYLQKNWEKVKREYVAIVEGKMQQKSGTIKSYLKERKNFTSYSTANAKDGKLAITKYEVINQSKAFTLLRINILTGRKNQIRVHLKELGYPIIGDKKYQSNIDPLHRLGLHASKIEFIHPKTNKKIIIETSIPTSFIKMFPNK